jgi:quercetin dioxygenase-like cupin family protein
MDSQPSGEEKAGSALSPDPPRESTPAASSAPVRVGSEELRLPGSRTRRFEGESYGSGISYFQITYEPGDSVALHRHPYTETWVVLSGSVEFNVGGSRYAAHGDETVVAPANTWHGFTNTGHAPLMMLCIHASPRIIQEWKEDVDAGSRG